MVEKKKPPLPPNEIYKAMSRYYEQFETPKDPKRTEHYRRMNEIISVLDGLPLNEARDLLVEVKYFITSVPIVELNQECWRLKRQELNPDDPESL